MSEPRFDFQLTAPCSKDWSELDGDERSRHCAECQLDVLNLSALTRAEGEAHLEAHRGGRTCLFFLRHPDGRIVTTDDPVPVARRPRRSWWRRVAAGFAAMGVGLLPSCFQTQCEEAPEEACPEPVVPEEAQEGEHDYEMLAELGGYWADLGVMEYVGDDEP